MEQFTRLVTVINEQDQHEVISHYFRWFFGKYEGHIVSYNEALDVSVCLSSQFTSEQLSSCEKAYEAVCKKYHSCISYDWTVEKIED
jgi:hypothetical protein